MRGYGQVRMKGKLTKGLNCKCCTAFNHVKLKKYSKVTEQKEIEEGVNELYYDENINYASYEVIKSLFPNAKEIYLKYDPIEDHHFFEVDRKFGAWQENVDYLLSYQYFTGASYNDVVDLTRKACEDRTLHKNDAHWFLP